jgi:hypothetical protein
MRKSIQFVLLAMALLMANSMYAQRVKVKSGSLDVLKDQKSVNVEFTYDNMTVGKFDNEKAYVDKKTADYNKSEAGKGDTWAKNWVNDRKERYEPKFIELFSKASDKTVDDDAKYTIIFHTVHTEPGFNIGVMRKNAYIDAEVTVVETKNRNKEIAKLTITDIPGQDVVGFDFDTGWRISEAYAKAGKTLGKKID